MELKVQDLQEQFGSNPFLKHVGFEIFSLEEKNIVIKLSIKKEHHNTNHNLHGGVHAAMLDTVQALILRASYDLPVVALNINVHYIAPSSSGDLYATAKIIQKGFKTATVESQITDSNDYLIAKGTGVYKILAH